MSDNIKMPLTVFQALFRLLYAGIDTETDRQTVTTWIEAKSRALSQHDLYSKSKDFSLPEEAREQAGIQPDFRFDNNTRA